MADKSHEAQAHPMHDVKAFADIQSFASAGYDLGEFAPQDNFEASAEWFDLLQENIYADDPSLRYYFVAQNNQPLTILPLKLTKKGPVRKIESLGNFYTTLYAPLLGRRREPVALRHMLTAAIRDHGGAHVMRFTQMDPDSLAYKALFSELRAIGWIPFRFFCFGNWYLKVRGNWEAYLKNRSANLRSSLKRRNRNFAEAGGTLEIATTADQIEDAISAFEQVYSASWKKPEPYPQFIPSLIRRLAASGMLRLGIAWLNGTPVAAQIWIVGEGKASIYKVAYHKSFASLSPGTVLTGHLLRHVIDCDRVREVDFLIGDDKYKRIWMSDRRERWGIIAYNPWTAIGCALLTIEITGRMIKQAGARLAQYAARSRPPGAPSTNSCPDTIISPSQIDDFHQDRDMTWSIHPIARFADFCGQWDALVQSRPGTPFLESAFLQPALDVFGRGDEVLCLLHGARQLRAAAIMQKKRKGVWQTFQPSQLPLGAWISDDAIDFVSAAGELMTRLPGYSIGLGITQQDPRIQPRPEDNAKLRSQDYIQTAWVDIDGDFERYWDARGKNLRQNTRKQHNKLQQEGVPPRIECLTGPNDVGGAIADYASLEGTGWKASDGTAILADNAQGRFYRKMLENFCKLGRGRIYRYWFGEKVAAMDLCIHDETTIVILKTSYDESFKSISPSTLMRQEEFRQLFAERKFGRIEFYGKLMEWHTRWTTQSRIIYHATFYRWAWLKALHLRSSMSQSARRSTNLAGGSMIRINGGKSSDHE